MKFKVIEPNRTRTYADEDWWIGDGGVLFIGDIYNNNKIVKAYSPQGWIAVESVR